MVEIWYVKVYKKAVCKLGYEKASMSTYSSCLLTIHWRLIQNIMSLDFI